MSIKQIENLEHFQKLISAWKPTIALFSANWAEQSQKVVNILHGVLTLYPDLQIINVPAEEEFKAITEKYYVNNLPIVIFFRNNKILHYIDGYDTISLIEKCRSLAEESKENRLEALKSNAEIMVFIRGTKEDPRCKFSKEIVALLEISGLPYKTFDVLSDEKVRNDLNEYWPQIPQVYVNGKLKGGLSIVKRLTKIGALMKYLQA